MVIRRFRDRRPRLLAPSQILRPPVSFANSSRRATARSRSSSETRMTEAMLRFAVAYVNPFLVYTRRSSPSFSS